MDIFKKTIKYSKPSIEIDNKIKNLNEGLKKTKSTLSEQKFSEEEVNEILSEQIVDVENWKEIFDENTVSEYEKQIDEIRDRHNNLIKVQGSIEYVKNKEVKEIFSELYQGEVEKVVDTYVSKYSNDIINLREDLFHEIKKEPVVDLRVLEEKINLLTLKYNQLSEGLLNEPSTGLENAVTFDQLKDHYQLLVGRLQEQLVTLGGGGEVRLQYLDDIVGIATNAAAYDGKFLKYNHSLKKFEFVTVTGGSGIGLTDLSVTTNSAGTAALSYNNNGVFTYTPPSFVGYATEGYVNNAVVGFITTGALSGYATEGYVNNAVTGITYVENAGIATIATYTSEWTLGANGSSDYTFTGPGLTGAENDPKIYLVKGQQYKFTNNMGAHPFRIQSTPNGSTGTQYNDGIVNNDVSNGTLTWNVQFDSPSVLYYQCTAHSNMGGQIIIGDDDSNLSIQTLEVSGISTFNGNIIGDGDTNISGINSVTATAFYGDLNGSITDATNLTGGGRCDASTLNITGIATISSGRIQADASSNLRFGNVASGSGSGRNIAIGDQVLGSLSSGNGRNIGIGELSFNNAQSGSYNIGVGIKAGEKITSGDYNVVLGGYDGNSGNLDIRTLSNRVVIADGEGNIRQYIDSEGKVGINTTVITETLTVAGIVSATSFYGTVPSSQLSGALPAIDGSALINVTGTGSGVVIKNNTSPVGTAGTIDFGSGLDVSFASGIATVSGASSVSEATTAYGLAGSPDINVGVATATRFVGSGISLTGITADQVGALAGVASDTNPQLGGNLDVNGNNIIGIGSVSLTGIITATSFYGSAVGLTSIPAGQLTGNLPAIDGSALLNVNATGDGVVVENSGSNVGSAKTINFDTGLDVTYSSGIATVTASGGSLQSRTIVSASTGSIADNAVGLVTVTGFKSYALMKVGLSTEGWIRIYTDSASRTADSSRSVGIDPAPGSGVIAEVVTTGISTEQKISPFTMGGNMDDPVDTTIYMSITNLSGSTQAINANLTILQLEA